MPQTFPEIVRMITLLIIGLSLAISLLYCFRRETPAYLKFFPVYCFVSLFVEVIVFFFYSGPGHWSGMNNHMPYNLFTVFELFLFAWFLYQLIQSRMVKRAVIILLLLFLWFFIWDSRNNDIRARLNTNAILFESLILIALCLVFLKELFKRPEPIDLLQEPSFWMVTGILFYFGSIFPYYLARQYLFTHGMVAVSHTLHSINNFSLAITHILFIKGYTCRIKKS